MIDSMERLRELRGEYSGYDPTIKLGQVFGTCTMGEFIEFLNAHENLLLERQYSAGQVREITRLQRDRADHDLALRDALSETARTTDELCFWRYQAIFYCACVGGYLSDPSLQKLQEASAGIPEQWLKEAERRLEDVRTRENRERVAHAEAPRDPSAT